MKKIIFILLLALAMTGCAMTQNLGDGKVDEVEASVIRVAVGGALAAYPAAIAPAYAVSTAVLQFMDGSEAVDLSMLESKAGDEINKLQLTDLEKQSAIDLLGVVKANIKAELTKAGITDPDAKLVVVKTVLEIIKESAKARLVSIQAMRPKGEGIDLAAFREKLQLRVRENRTLFDKGA